MRKYITVAMTVIIALFCVPAASAQSDLEVRHCASVGGTSTRADHNAYVRKVYHRQRVTMKARLRIERFQRCASTLDALDDMERFQQQQAKARQKRLALRAKMYCGTPSCNRVLFVFMSDRRYGRAGTNCSLPILSQESGFSHTVSNGRSGAYGIPQALPGSKMASAGSDWATNPVTQIRWYFSYVDGRYGGPCGALSHKRAYNWY